MVCDWKTLVENEGAGGLVVAIVWALWTWFKKRGSAVKVK